jgi:hypothetical protein
VSILVATATAIGVTILSVGNPATLFAEFADVATPLVNKSALQPGTDQSTPTIQSTADARASTADALALPPTAKDAPTRDALFRQFQAWAADKDAQARVGPVRDAPGQVVQNAPAPVTANARASLRPMQEDRHVRPVHHEQAEIRPVQNPRKKVRQEQTARAEVPPVQDAGAQDQPMQNFLQGLGLRNRLP